jgi:hypothetical protein
MNLPRMLSSLLALLLLTVAAESQAAPSPGPDHLARQGASGPFFISARNATDTDGNVRWSAFDQGTSMYLRSRLDAERSRKSSAGAASTAGSGPCAEAIISSSHLSAPTRSLDDLVTNARAIYRGVVSSLTPGFETSRPVTVVGIDIASAVRTSAGFPATGRVLIIHPYADFKIGDARFCNAASEDSAPQIGDHVILFAYEPALDTSQTFLVTTPEQLFIERDNKLIVPQYLKDPSITASTLEQLERRIAQFTAASRIVLASPGWMSMSATVGNDPAEPDARLSHC